MFSISSALRAMESDMNTLLPKVKTVLFYSFPRSNVRLSVFSCAFLPGLQLESANAPMGVEPTRRNAIVEIEWKETMTIISRLQEKCPIDHKPHHAATRLFLVTHCESVTAVRWSTSLHLSGPIKTTTIWDWGDGGKLRRREEISTHSSVRLFSRPLVLFGVVGAGAARERLARLTRSRGLFFWLVENLFMNYNFESYDERPGVKKMNTSRSWIHSQYAAGASGRLA